MTGPPYINPRTLVEQSTGLDGRPVWPGNPEARTLLARALLGRQLVARFDGSLDVAIDYLEKPDALRAPSRNRTLQAQERRLRSLLAGLSSTQREAVRFLLTDTLSSFFFGCMVVLDQPKFAESIRVEARMWGHDETASASIAPLPSEDLHDEVHEWIWSFSRYAQETVDRSEDDCGTTIGPRGFDK